MSKQYMRTTSPSGSWDASLAQLHDAWHTKRLAVAMTRTVGPPFAPRKQACAKHTQHGGATLGIRFQNPYLHQHPRQDLAGEVQVGEVAVADVYQCLCHVAAAGFQTEGGPCVCNTVEQAGLGHLRLAIADGKTCHRGVMGSGP